MSVGAFIARLTCREAMLTIRSKNLSMREVGVLEPSASGQTVPFDDQAFGGPQAVGLGVSFTRFHSAECRLCSCAFRRYALFA